MKLSLYTPIKQVKDSQLRRIESEQAIIPITMNEELTNRLKDNVKVIEMINNSRFERSKSRRKDQLFGDSSQQGTLSKKKVVNQIINKLDSALKQSRASLQNSRRCHSETKDMQEKIKAFEHILREVKQTNMQNCDQLNKMKNQVETEANTRSGVDYYKPKSQLKYEIYTYNPQENRNLKPKTKYGLKDQYVYPKYLKPQTFKRRTANLCIQPECRTYCKCKR